MLGWPVAAAPDFATRSRIPDAIIRTIEQADLRGMGGAGFPTHRKWRMIAAHQGWR